jgi:hypothetical protein
VQGSLASAAVVSGTEFPSEVRAFIERHITTGAQLEVLLLLHGDPDRHWTAAAAGRELRIDAEQSEKALARLAAGGLLVLEGPGYRFAPRRARKAELVAALAALYPTYRVAIISLIFSKPSGPIRDFSEAFRLKEED